MSPRDGNKKLSRALADKLSTAKIYEINKTRKAFELPPLKIIERNCLKCDQTFTSEGVGHRLCERCRDIGERIDGGRACYAPL